MALRYSRRAIGACASLLCPLTANASALATSYTDHWLGYSVLGLFAVAYVMVMLEEVTHMRKSKPVMLAAGLIWALIAAVYAAHGDSPSMTDAVRHHLLDFAEIFLFLLVAMTYINTLEEHRVFDALRAWLVNRHFGYRTLFWCTGILAFFISAVADNLTTALVLCAVVTALGRDNPRFVALGCINLVVAANAGGAFSPFGDITTLMVWQKGVLDFWVFFKLFIPSLVSFTVPAFFMHFAIPSGAPARTHQAIAVRPGGRGIILLFALTITLTVMGHNFWRLPPVFGMMLGLACLQIYSYLLRMKSTRAQTTTSDVVEFDIFRKIA
ncbi:MAG: sodium:proton antiporter NhaD, partial [Pseudomonadota bacterium]